MIASLAELEFRAGNVEHAFDLAIKCLNLQRAAQSWRHLLITLANIAAYSVALNRWDRARAYAREALALAQEAQHATALASVLQHLAAVAVLSAAPSIPPMMAAPESSSLALARAALLLGYVDGCAVQLGLAREYTEQHEYDRVLAALRAAVPADDLAQHLAHGSMLTPEQAIELALSI
jgi:tetratricopeptide (TPR) repeat protein